jgi:phenylalanyl-tRNA synthetase alpha chain
MDLLTELTEFQTSALEAIQKATRSEELEEARITYLGARKGRLKDLQSSLGKVPKEEKPLVGKKFNEVKQAVEAALDQRQRELTRPKVSASDLDITLPGVAPRLGRLHPLTQTIGEFKEIMGRFGFSVAEGPEIEDEYHNFHATVRCCCGVRHQPYRFG